MSGTDIGGTGRYSVGNDYKQYGFSYTNNVNDSLSYALIVEQPYGTHVTYEGNPLTDNLAGTSAELSSRAASVVLRYRFGERFSIHGGVSYEAVKADVTLNGAAYRDAITSAALIRATPGLTRSNFANQLATNPAIAGAIAAQSTAFVLNNGYAFNMQEDSAFNYLIGATYEIPDIALRFAATYRFETDHSASTVETVFGRFLAGTVNYKTPQSLNLDFQTGIAENTLLTASYRWTDFSAVNVVPMLLQSDLVNIDDSHRYTLGLAHRFNDSLAASVTFIYEPENNDPTVSPLGPTDGLFGITVGGQYTFDNLKLSGGINYSRLGDANPGVAGTPVASFTDNSAIGIGVKAAFSF
ncbi:membrane protein involved in aromatic hydrocarbon degradation [Roseobacter sp. AzwK-3b]|nr:membrane protein involved in aromatic hydrocarbon degradation [Roseobacter sp. AzwK-3b]